MWRLKTTDGGTGELIVSGTTFPAQQFVHVAAVYDGTTMSLWQNGVLVGSLPKTGQIVTNSAVPMWIGNNPVGPRSFDGRVDNLRIYNRALSGSEIQIDMAAAVTTPVALEYGTGSSTPFSSKPLKRSWQASQWPHEAPLSSGS